MILGVLLWIPWKIRVLREVDRVSVLVGDESRVSGHGAHKIAGPKADDESGLPSGVGQ